MITHLTTVSGSCRSRPSRADSQQDVSDSDWRGSGVCCCVCWCWITGACVTLQPAPASGPAGDTKEAAARSDQWGCGTGEEDAHRLLRFEPWLHESQTDTRRWHLQTSYVAGYIKRTVHLLRIFYSCYLFNMDFFCGPTKIESQSRSPKERLHIWWNNQTGQDCGLLCHIYYLKS